jgi:hypothetical protein
MQIEETPIERKETGIRILLTLLFGLIMEVVVEVLLIVVILFELAYVLITKQPPGEQVKRFANRILSYLYRILRYLTYNEPEAPFPFADFPSEVEPSASSPKRREEGNEEV